MTLISLYVGFTATDFTSDGRNQQEIFCLHVVVIAYGNRLYFPILTS